MGCYLGLPPGEEPIVQRLAARLGEWPVLLTLVNRALHEQISRGMSLVEALTYIDDGLTEVGLTAFDATDPAARDQAVAKTVEVSLALLSVDDRARYAELAIFPEDVAIPLGTLEKLWSATGGSTSFRVRELCTRLARLSLLLAYDATNKTVRLHDIMRSYLERELGNQLFALHRRFLEVSRPSSNHWADVPFDEPYLWDYMIYHLIAAGQQADTRMLLLDFGWLRAKLEARNIQALIADFDSLPDATDLRLVQGALRLSAHILSQDRTQLAGQILGRLQASHSPAITQLLEQVRQQQAGPWLRPLSASLLEPGGPLIRTLTGHTDTVTAIAVLPDERHVISGSMDQTLKLWNIEHGALVRTLHGHSASVSAVAVTTNGKYAVSGAYDGTLRVWDLQTGTQIRTLEGHPGVPNAIAVVKTIEPCTGAPGSAGMQDHVGSTVLLAAI